MEEDLEVRERVVFVFEADLWLLVTELAVVALSFLWVAVECTAVCFFEVADGWWFKLTVLEVWRAVL